LAIDPREDYLEAELKEKNAPNVHLEVGEKIIFMDKAQIQGLLFGDELREGGDSLEKVDGYHSRQVVNYFGQGNLVFDVVPRHGRDLVGQAYEPLFDYYSSDPKLKNRENGWKIYPADFVTTDEGTGIVHVAPAFGEEDMGMGKKFNLPFVQHIEMNGAFKPEVKDFAGLPAKPKADPQVTDKKIIALLRERGALFAEQPITHSYPHCWRCETPLLNYAASSWFVNVQKIKKKLIANNKRVLWTPAHIRDGRFGKALEGAPDWAISRSRYWGAPLPVWKCDAGSHVVVIGSLAELKKAQGKGAVLPKNGKGEVDLHRPYIDRIVFACPCGSTMRRIPEVLDCWFESGSMPYGQWHHPFENQKKFDPKKGVGFPADFIDEGLDQTRGWFYSLLVLATALFGKAPYRHVNVHGTILAEDGQKMSKRLKNYPDPMEVVGKYGADALRLYLTSQPVVQGEDLNFSLKAVDEIYKKYSLIVANTLNFYLLYKDHVHTIRKAQSAKRKAHILDRWILSRLHHAIGHVTEAFESYELIAATRALTEFVEDLSLWYVRRSRERVKSAGPDAEAALSVLYLVLFNLARLMAPVTPFLAETIYQSLRSSPKSKIQNPKLSVHLEDWPKVERPFMNKRLESDMREIRAIASHALRLRAEAGIKVRQPLQKLKIKNQKSKIKNNRELLGVLADEINVKEIVFDPKIAPEFVLDTTITPELREEGVVRELTRSLQDIRKKHGLTPRQNVRFHIAGLTKEFLERWQKHLEREINGRVMAGRAQGGETVTLEGMELAVRLVLR
jgi:isoleucyl-tRNA synthetase